MTHSRNALMLSLAAALGTSGAAARPELPTAVFVFEKPLRHFQRAIVEEHVLSCENDRCVGRIEPLKAWQIRTCRTLYRRYGALTAVTIGSEVWSSEQVTNCNKRG